MDDDRDDTRDSPFRAPPHSDEAEQSLIGAVLLGADWSLVGGMDASAFYHPKHRLLWMAATEVAASGAGIDVVTVAERLSSIGKLSEIGGNAYIAEIVDRTVGVSNAEAYRDIVLEKHGLRQRIRAGMEMQEAGFAQDAEALREAEAKIAANGWAGASSLPFSWETAEEAWPEMEPMDWMWRGWLPRGGLVLFAGVEGTGKTTLMLKIVADVTRGRLAGMDGRAGRVVLWAGEDNPAITLGRLRLYGADLGKVILLGRDRPFVPTEHLDMLLTKLERDPVDLVVFDPLISTVKGDNNDPKVIRESVESVSKRLEAVGTTLFGLGHFTKDSSDRPLVQRYMGSGAYSQIARAVWTLIEVDDRLLWGKAKVSWGDRRGVYDVSIEAQRVTYDDGRSDEVGIALLGDLDTERNLDQIERELKGTTGEKRPIAAKYESQAVAARMWLELQNGYVTSTSWDAYCNDLQIKRRGREHIQDHLEMKSVKRGMQPNQISYWHLPEFEVPP